MINNIINYLKNKKILLLGYGKEGQSSYKFFQKYLPNSNIGIADKNKIDLIEHSYITENNKIKLHIGEDYFNSINEYDIIIKSPGISLKDIDIKKFRVKLTSQIELFLKFSNVLTIGITGTKGKSTTASLIYFILSQVGKKVKLVGNIGVPVFDIFLDNSEITSDFIIVMEMSSHQLEFSNSSPNISIMLNLYEEHLDYYKSYESYKKAKSHIYLHQLKKDILLYNMDNEDIQNLIKSSNLVQKKWGCTYSDISNISIEEIGLDGIIYISGDNYIKIKNKECSDIVTLNIEEKLNILGKHNIYNIMFAIGVFYILNIEIELIIKYIKKFKGLPHRMEYVGKYNEILFYNDSISTIPESTIYAIETLKEVKTIIIGGYDRGINYDKLAYYLSNSNIKYIIFLPQTGKEILKIMLKNHSNLKKDTFKVENLQEAVDIAKKITGENNICLFSPAAPSYGQFKNFEERGNLFKKLLTE